MNYLNECQPAEEVLKKHFRTMIITNFVGRDKENGQIVTLVSHIGMFDEIVMGINKSLRSGGKVQRWQSQVFTVHDGQILNTITYQPIIISGNN